MKLQNLTTENSMHLQALKRLALRSLWFWAYQSIWLIVKVQPELSIDSGNMSQQERISIDVIFASHSNQKHRLGEINLHITN